YRVGLEAILGFRKEGDTLVIEPRGPASWPEYTIEYRYGKSVYVIAVRAAGGKGAVEVTVDGSPSEDGRIRLADDGRRHEATVSRAGANLPNLDMLITPR